MSKTRKNIFTTLLNKFGVLGDAISSSKELTESEVMAQYVISLLRSGKADKVTDEMLSAADDTYLFNNYDLPMDEASRLARAKADNYDFGWYHGTNADYDKFRGYSRPDKPSGTYLVKSPDVADSYVRKNEDGTILRLAVRGVSEFPVVKGDGAYWHKISKDALPEELKHTNRLLEEELWTDYIATGAKNAGYGGTKFEDIIDRGPNAVKQYKGETDAMAKLRTYLASQPADVLNVVKPSSIRSEYARFDSRLKDLKNLSAAIAPVATAGALSQIKGRPQ
jgi:hypothetical protein